MKSEAIPVVEVVSKGGANGPILGTPERLSVGQGDVIEVALSTAQFLKPIVDRRAGTVRFALPDEKFIRAPHVDEKLTTVDELIANPSEREGLLKRAQEYFLELHNLPEGHTSWQRYAAHQTAEERNAGKQAERAKAKTALGLLLAEIGKASERKVAEAEAALAAARAEVDKVQATKVKPSREQLLEDLEQAEAQIEAFRNATVEPGKIELAQKRAETVRGALAVLAREGQGRSARALLEGVLAKYDVAQNNLAARARPYVEEAQAALAAGNFERVVFFAQRIRDALVPTIDWTTETRPGMFGASVHHGPGSQHHLGPAH